MPCVPIQPAADTASTEPLDVVWDKDQLLVGSSAELPAELTGEAHPLLACTHVRLDAAGADELIATLIRARFEAFGRPPARAVVVEVIEQGRATDDSMTGGLIMPSDVRINGQSVLTEGGVKINSIEVPPRALPTVTITMPVRRVTIAAEGDLAR